MLSSPRAENSSKSLVHSNTKAGTAADQQLLSYSQMVLHPLVAALWNSSKNLLLKKVKGQIAP